MAKSGIYEVLLVFSLKFLVQKVQPSWIRCFSFFGCQLGKELPLGGGSTQHLFPAGCLDPEAYHTNHRGLEGRQTYILIFWENAIQSRFPRIYTHDIIPRGQILNTSGLVSFIFEAILCHFGQIACICYQSGNFEFGTLVTSYFRWKFPTLLVFDSFFCNVFLGTNHFHLANWQEMKGIWQ